MEKRFSLENVFLETKKTLQRFPLAILIAVTGTVSCTGLIGHPLLDSGVV